MKKRERRPAYNTNPQERWSQATPGQRRTASFVLQTKLGPCAQAELNWLLLNEGSIGGNDITAAAHWAHTQRAQEGKAQLDPGVKLDQIEWQSWIPMR